MSTQCASARSKHGLAYVEQGQAGAEPTTTSRRGGPRVDDEGRVREGGRKGKCGGGGGGRGVGGGGEVKVTTMTLHLPQCEGEQTHLRSLDDRRNIGHGMAVAVAMAIPLSYSYFD